jgi:hypothetical protein
MPQEFFLKLEQTSVPGVVKATAVEAPPSIWGPTDPRPGYGPTPPGGGSIWEPLFPTNPIVIPPIDEPPSPPEAKLTSVFSPTHGKWVYGYQLVSGAGPKKEDPCEPPAPPGYQFAWVFAPQYNGWVWGYQRESGAGPK